MSFPEFAELFSAVYGFDPFPWQGELARLVASEGWPADLQVPTGLGKTAVLDVAVWALSAEAARPASERCARTRTFLVVDRRLVVDQAFVRAQGLSEKLQQALQEGDNGPIGAVARALATIGEPDGARGERALSVTRMRGGTTWATRWIRRPDLPAVVVGTVDQLGSRALFRGYGVGQRRLPIDAALVGTDVLVVLDEVHLAQPFVETLEAVQALESGAPHRIGRPLQIVRMSATLPRREAPALVGSADRAHEIAGPRLRASKLARLVETDSKTGPSVIAGLAHCHLGPAGEPRASSVAVVVNTIRLARSVLGELERRGVPAVLLVGRVRGADRDRIAESLRPFMIGNHPAPDDPRVVVATQTVEVGVDLDVGALVVEAAPLDSLIQRLGRLDRGGARERTEVTLVRVDRQDLVYGAPAEETWNLLRDLAGGAESIVAPPRSLDDLASPRLDLGTVALDELLGGVDRERLVARTEPGPVVLPPVLDLWARTAPLPVPDEPVAEYLHGFERSSASLSIAWRAVAPGAGEEWEVAIARALDVVSVRSDEQVEVPIWEAMAFLEGRTVDAGADVATEGIEDAPEKAFQPCVRVDDGEVHRCRRRQDVRPGSILVLPSIAGGYDRWGWTGRAGGVVPDVADLCRPRGTLRLDPLVLASLGLGEVDVDPIAATFALARAGEDDDHAALRDAVGSLLSELGARADGEDSALSKLLRKASDRLAEIEPGRPEEPLGWRTVLTETHDRTYLLRWRERPADAGAGLELGDEADADDSPRSTSRTGSMVELGEHCRAVGARAAGIARRIGLDEAAARAVELAALAHDLGKADPRFQLSLWGGDRFRQEADGRLLAKSDQPRARHGPSWPRGMRHEAVSATLVECFLAVAGGPDVDASLVRHLVLAHHGHGRPLMPPRETGPATPFAVAPPTGGEALFCAGIGGQVDWRHPRELRELCRHYGWWGLALLETIVRSADVCESEEGR